MIKLDGPLPFEAFPIPGGNAPVPMAVLREEPAIRARTLVVRFPAGWHRPGPGYYEAAEELIVLDGALTMSGVTYHPGDYGYVPAHATRFETSVEAETLVFARFDGPARYREGEGTSQEPQPAGPPDPTRLIAVAGGSPAPVDTELLELATNRWCFVEKGMLFPAFDGLCFARTFESGEPL